MQIRPSGPMNPNECSRPAQIPGFTNKNPRKRSATVQNNNNNNNNTAEAMKQCYTFRSTSAN